MEKKVKIVKTIVVILLAILLFLIAFGGLFVKRSGVWTNILPQYKYGMELSGFRELHFVLDDTEEEKEIYIDENGNYLGDVKESSTSTDSGVSLSMVDENGEEVENPEEVLNGTEETEEAVEKTEEKPLTETRTIKANPDEARTIDNFEKTKQIIQRRLDKIDFNEYNIRQNNITGELVVELPENDNVSLEEALITTPGKINIIDYQTGMILLDSTHVKSSNILGSTTDDGYQTYLQLKFDKEGTNALRDISNKYRAVVDETGNQTISYVSVELDGAALITTYFGDEIVNGTLQIPYGQAISDYNEYLEFAKKSSYIATVINDDSLPLQYKLSGDNYINTATNTSTLVIIFIVFVSVVLIISLVMLIMYRSKSIKFIGAGIIYISLLTIICRLTNVYITYNSLIAFVSVAILNYYLYFKILQSIKSGMDAKQALKENLKEVLMAIIPAAIIAVIFIFMASVVISSIGMLLFWGIVLLALVSLITLI